MATTPKTNELRKWAEERGWPINTHPLSHIFMEMTKMERELALAKGDRAAWQRSADAAHAKLDALMLEFCPEEMSARQKARRAAHQRRVNR